ncbi:SAM-dependent methyltransferase [Paraburkholderia sp. B3]|uniref:SAM-dependent methyltransferase n=1 Tax=Paraburkholderia sp. B3 TaxID=3134791 RepID=UPI0039820420
MTHEAARTSVDPMALVALEQHFAPRERIVTDPLAVALLPGAARAALARMGPRAANVLAALAERRYPGLWGGILCRKRFIDDKLREALDGIEALVNLGAGFDTRAYRMLPGTRVRAWELDQPVNIDAKWRRLSQRLGSLPPQIHLVAADLGHDALDATLTAHGYAPQQRTFFIWEGVTQYLDEAGVRKTLEFLATAVPGSRLALTYVRRDFLEGVPLDGQDVFYRRFVAKHAIWRYGIDPAELPSLLASYGWRVIDAPEPAELARRYIVPTGRTLVCMPIERSVYAERI